MTAEVAVVVGAGGRLGAAIAEVLLARGLEVLGVGRDPDRIREALPSAGEGLRTLCGDVTSDEITPALARATAGRSVVMAVNAARPVASGSLLEVPTGALAAAVDVKAGGLLRLVRGVDSQLAPGARLVGLGGRLGDEPDARMCAAGIANAALANLVRQLAEAYHPRGVTAHVIAPGAVAGAQRLGHAPGADVLELPTPQDIAWAVAALLHPAGAHMSGSAIRLGAAPRPDRVDPPQGNP